MNLGIHMKKNNTLFAFTVLALLLSITSLSLADSLAEGATSNNETTIKLKPGHPQQYTVQKGDTLWDISGKFLEQPWYWPEIWQANKQIENPNLIYPGDHLTLIYIDGRPYITRDKYGKRTVHLSPKTRIAELDLAIPTIPLDIIAPYLTKNRIVNPHEYNQLPYIVGISDNHLSASTGNTIYVKGIPTGANDKNFGVYRSGTYYRSPKTNKVLGHELIYLGKGHLLKSGSPSSILIEKAKAEIFRKHRVIPIAKNTVVDANFLPKASLMKKSASIIGVLTVGIQPGVSMVGSMDVVVIDAGLKDGIEIGDVFNIYKKGNVEDDPIQKDAQIQLPDENSGNLMVFRPFNHLSYALVLDTKTSLRIGDVIKSPLMENE